MVCVCVCERERERVRERVCVCVFGKSVPSTRLRYDRGDGNGYTLSFSRNLSFFLEIMKRWESFWGRFEQKWSTHLIFLKNRSKISRAPRRTNIQGIIQSWDDFQKFYDIEQHQICFNPNRVKNAVFWCTGNCNNSYDRIIRWKKKKQHFFLLFQLNCSFLEDKKYFSSSHTTFWKDIVVVVVLFLSWN